MPAAQGEPPREVAKGPLDLVLDSSGTLLVARIGSAGEGLVSAPWDPGEAVSATTAIAGSVADVLLAMNQEGVALAVWRDGQVLKAARSQRR